MYKLIYTHTEMCFWLQSVPGNQLQLTVELSGGCYTDTSHVALWLTGCVYEMSAVVNPCVLCYRSTVSTCPLPERTVSYSWRHGPHSQ